LGGVVLTLRQAELSEDVLILCDNESVLKAIKKWIGQGGRATLTNAPDADILREIVELLRTSLFALSLSKTQAPGLGRACERCVEAFDA